MHVSSCTTDTVPGDTGKYTTLYMACMYPPPYTTDTVPGDTGMYTPAHQTLKKQVPYGLLLHNLTTIKYTYRATTIRFSPASS